MCVCVLHKENAARVLWNLWLIIFHIFFPSVYYMWTHRARHAENSNIGSYPPVYVQCNFLINSRHPAVCEILRLMCYYTNILYKWNRIPAANSRAHFFPFFSLFLSQIIAIALESSIERIFRSRAAIIRFSHRFLFTRAHVWTFLFLLCTYANIVLNKYVLAQPLWYIINKCF